MRPSRWYVPRLVFVGDGGRGEECEVLIGAPTALDAVARASAWAETQRHRGELLGFAGMLDGEDERPGDGTEFGGWVDEAGRAELVANVKAPDALAAVRAECDVAAPADMRASSWYVAVLSFVVPSDEPLVFNEVCEVLFEAPTASVAVAKAEAWAAAEPAAHALEYLGMTRLERVGGPPDDGRVLITWPLELPRAELVAAVVHPTELLAVRLEGIDGQRPLRELLSDSQQRALLAHLGEREDDDG